MKFGKRNYAILTMGSAAILMGFVSWTNAQNRPVMVPADSVIPASTLDNLPHKDISNGIVSAKVYLPGEHGFYRGTRFDRAGRGGPCHLQGHGLWPVLVLQLFAAGP